jgi:hypothetical protein
MWIFGGAGAAIGILAIAGSVIAWSLRDSTLGYLALIPFVFGCLFIVVGGWRTAGHRYLSGLRADETGLHLRYDVGPASFATWSGIRLEFVHVDLPRGYDDDVGKGGADMDASWMLWLGGKCPGDVPPSLVDSIESAVSAHGLKVERAERPWKSSLNAQIVRIEPR